MKKYSFKLNSTKKNNNKTQYINTNSFSEALNNNILTNVINNNPWMKKLIKTDDHILFTKKKNTTPYYDFDEFIEAMNYLAGLNTLKDTYDYELTDGTPVKIFSDEIQIGYDLIPIKRGYTLTDYAALQPKTTKTIIDIYIKLNQ